MSRTPSPPCAPQPPVRLLLVAAPLAGSPLIAEAFPDAAPVVVELADLRVEVPWRGRLFDLLGEAAIATRPGGAPTVAAPLPIPTVESSPGRGAPTPGADGAAPVVGLVVPLRWLAAGPAPELAIVRDHLNARLRGPLTGRRPDGDSDARPQPFPSLTGLYQPETIRCAVGRRVYSVVAVAGVARVADLTPFERRAVTAAGCPAVCDCLVDTAIIAALHGLKVAACGVPVRP